MKEKSIFKVSKNTLLHSLNDVARVVQTKSTIPILSTILFNIKEKVLTLTGNGQENQIETSLELIESDYPISFCLDKSIIGILNTLPDQPITFHVIRKKLDEKISIDITILHSLGNIQMQGIDGVDFIRMNDFEGKALNIPIKNLLRGLNKTRKFAMNNSLYPTLNSVCIDISSDRTTFVSTDRYVVSVFEDFSIHNLGTDKLILGINTVNILTSLFNETTQKEMSIIYNLNSILFNIGNTTITSQLLEGNYVNYRSVVFTDKPLKLTIDSKELSNTLSRMISIVSSSSHGLVRMKVDSEKISLSADDYYSNKSAKEIISTTSNGEITIGIAGSSLNNLLSIIDDKVVLSFSEPNQPVVITPLIDESQTKLTLLTMSLILKDYF